MNQINKHKVGIVFATLLGGIHLVWTLLIAFGWAQSLIDFILRLHMIKLGFVVDSFSIGLAVTLVVVTTLIGYVVGYIFAIVWNKLHKTN